MEFIILGQSRNRNYSKNLGLSLNISIDTAIIIFDPITKASRSIHFPQKLSEIHSVVVIWLFISKPRAKIYDVAYLMAIGKT